MDKRVTVADGKYTFVDKDYEVDILRYNEPWIAGITGSRAILALMDHVQELEKLSTRIPELEAENAKIHADRVRLADKLTEIKAIVTRPKPNPSSVEPNPGDSRVGENRPLLTINGKNIQDVIQEELRELACDCSSHPDVVMLAAIRTLAKVGVDDPAVDAACEIEAIELDSVKPKHFPKWYCPKVSDL